MKRLIKYILIIIGSISVGLGILGIFLPLLPTTPFLLLAAACYARASDRFYNWLINHKLFGSYIRDYREKKGIKRKTRTVALITMWATIAISAIIVSNLLVAIILVSISVAVSFHLISLKTLN
jgi:hypothetical protein